MGEKKPSAIKKITLDKATFHNETIDHLSYVNFFYGNNGAGKSTIARCIKDGEGIEWAENRSPDNFEIDLYNQDFINDNFSRYDGINGVFTVDAENIIIQGQIDEMKKEQERLNDEIPAMRSTLTEKEKEPERLRTVFQDKCFEKTKKIRNDFDAALEGRKQRKGFADALLEETNPTEYDLEELKRLCDTAFDKTTREFPEFSRPSSVLSYENLPGKELLEKPIVSRSNTPFAQFIKALNATDWVRIGYEHYVKDADGKCPFCQGTLGGDFESKIADCFDEQYQQDIDDLIAFQNTYIAENNQIITKLEDNLIDVLPSADLTEYNSKLELLKKNIEINCQHLAEKVNEPTKIIYLEDTDLLISEIGIQIDKINKSIRENNNIVKGRRASRNKCRNNLIQYLAYFLADDIKKYKEEKDAAEKDKREYRDKLNEKEKYERSLSHEIEALNSQTVNTAEAMKAINQVLIESGFQGFHLRAKKGVDNTYEVIRENGELASDLSEGERNFIAFLYFQQMVSGSLDKKGAKDKIVIIDDPVSSMDSTSLFFVSGIVRTMIGICRNNSDYRKQEVAGDYIKQIFIFTHNVYFHREITYQQVGYYDCTSFYMIRKNSNISTVKLCERPSSVPTEMENYNPVQNSYAALWDELKEVKSTNTAKNVMRRIFEYYFMQLCGYEGEDLRKRILESEDNKNKFIVPKEKGYPDTSNYEMAMSLLSYIDTSHEVGDDLSFTEDSDNVDAYKNVFRLIFEALGQSQHYNMMMGIQEKS